MVLVSACLSIHSFSSGMSYFKSLLLYSVCYFLLLKNKFDWLIDWLTCTFPADEYPSTYSRPSVRCPTDGGIEAYSLCNVTCITVTFTTAAGAVFVAVGEPCKESEAGRADAGKDQVAHRGQGDEEQWDMDRLAVSPQGRRASHEGTHHVRHPHNCTVPTVFYGGKVTFHCKVWHFPQCPTSQSCSSYLLIFHVVYTDFIKGKCQSYMGVFLVWTAVLMPVIRCKELCWYWLWYSSVFLDSK